MSSIIHILYDLFQENKAKILILLFFIMKIDLNKKHSSGIRYQNLKFI